MKNKSGIPMTEEAKKEWEQSFKDIEESIELLDLQESKNNPYAKYLKLKQQDLF
jgi:hypothetical protein